MRSVEGSPTSERVAYRSSNFAWIASLCVPLTLYAGYLKITRVMSQHLTVGIRGAFALYGSDLAMQLSFALLAWAALIGVGVAPARTAVRVVLQGLALLYVFVLTASHGYFMSSGTSLDYTLLAFSLLHIDETAKVIGSAGTNARLIVLGCTVLAVVVLPWRVGLRTRLRVMPGRVERMVCVALCLGLSFAMVRVALRAEQAASAGVDVARDPLLNIMLTYVSATDDDVSFMERTAKYPRGAKRLEAGPQAKKKNVVFVFLESTGAWATSMHGEHKTTPYLAELAAKSVQADRMYAVVPHTSKALVASLCGIDARPGVGVPEAVIGGIPGRCIPELLRERGYATVMMQSATREFENRAQLARNLGFDSFISGDEMDTTGLEKANYFGYEDRILVGPVRKWLRDRKPDQPFVFSILTNTPHHDYRTLLHYGSQNFVQEPLRNRYLNSIRYQDFVLREIVQAFERAGLASSTIFIILGDHGEGLGQHKRYVHDDMIYEEGLRVPFLIYEPEGGRPPAVMKGPFNELDIAPTVLDLLGLNISEGRYQGRSLFAANTPRVLYAACYNDFKCLARFEGNLKFIDFFERQKPVLFDVASDPQERKDLLPAQPKLLEPARRDLRSWYGAVRNMYRQAVARAPSEFVSLTKPKVQFARNVMFGDYVELVGVSSTKPATEPSGWLRVTYTFYVRKKLPEGYHLFIHGYDGLKIYPWNHVPGQRLLPEDVWEPGQYISDVHIIRVPDTWRGKMLVVRGGFVHDRGARLKPTPSAPDNAPVFIQLPVLRR